MPNQLQLTRQYVQQLFCQLDQPTETPLRETILLRQGQYCGHRFSNDRLSAVWFLEEDEIKVYDAEHHLIRVETHGTHARAA